MTSSSELNNLPSGLNAYHALLAQIVGLDGKDPRIIVSTSGPVYGEFADQANTVGGVSSTEKPPQQNWSDLVNNIPVVGAIYTPSGNMATQAYADLLGEIQYSLARLQPAKTPEQQKQLDDLQNQRDDQLTKVTAARNAAGKAFASDKSFDFEIGVAAPTWASWLTTSEAGQVWDTEQKKFDDLSTQIDALISETEATKQVRDAITQYDNGINPDKSGLTPQLPWDWSGDLNNDIQIWRQKGASYAESVQAALSAKQPAPAKPVSFSAANDIGNKKATASESKTKISVGFLFGSTTSNKSSSSTENSSTDTKIGLHMQAIQVDVRNVVSSKLNGRDWYHQQVLKNFDNNNSFNPRDSKSVPLRSKPPRLCDVANWSGDEDDSDVSAYGLTDKAIYPWRIAQVIMAFQPTISVSMDKSTYDQLKTNSANSSGGGGFFLFGMASKEHQDASTTSTTSWDDESSSITIADTSQNPLVLGFVMEPMPGIKG